MGTYYKATSRSSVNHITYVEIAIQSYFDAIQKYEKIDEKNISLLLQAKYDIEKYIIQTIVFSTMAIESYLNDYISGCIGDNEYYENYDKLNMMVKLDLIKRFIFHDKTKESDKLYTYTRELQKARNDLVHNKPRTVNVGMTEEEMKNMIEYEKNNPDYIEKEVENTISSSIKDMKDNLKKGINALKAVVNLATYIDKMDRECYATVSLFWPSIYDEDSNINTVKKKIYPLIGIKIQDYT